MTIDRTGQPPAYDERLRVPAMWWVLPAFFIASLWLAYLVATGPGWAALVAAATGGIAAVSLLSYGNALVRVHNGMLTAGRAQIPVHLLGEIRALDAAQARALRGPKADPRVYLLIRPYLPEAVRVEIDDPDDPTPYWLIATRKPQTLAEALRAERARTI